MASAERLRSGQGDMPRWRTLLRVGPVYLIGLAVLWSVLSRVVLRGAYLFGGHGVGVVAAIALSVGAACYLTSWLLLGRPRLRALRPSMWAILIGLSGAFVVPDVVALAAPRLLSSVSAVAGDLYDWRQAFAGMLLLWALPFGPTMLSLPLVLEAALGTGSSPGAGGGGAEAAEGSRTDG